MNVKTKLNYFIDWLLFLAMIIIIITGIVLWGWKKPAGMGGPGGPNGPGVANSVMKEKNPSMEGSASGHFTKSETESDNTSDKEAKTSSEKEAVKGETAPLPQNKSLEKSGKNNKDNQPKILWGLFHGQTFLGMTKNGGWKEIHCWVSVIILVPFFLFHLLMHLKWIGKTTISIFGKKSLGITPNAESVSNPSKNLK